MGVSSSLRNSALKQLKRNVERRGLALTLMPEKELNGLEGIPTFHPNMREVEVADPFIVVKPFTVTVVMMYLGNYSKEFKYLSPVTLQNVLEGIWRWIWERTGEQPGRLVTFSIDGKDIGDFDPWANSTDWKSDWKSKSKITKDMTITLKKSKKKYIPQYPAYTGTGQDHTWLTLTGRESKKQ